MCCYLKWKSWKNHEGKAFAPPGSFYIVDAINCDNCGKVKLIYEGCNCDVEVAKCDLMGDKVRMYCDTVLSILNQVKEEDIYLAGLCRGQITAFEKVLELIGEIDETTQ